MSKETPISTEPVPFNQYESEIRPVRQRIFIDEYRVPAHLEWDSQDDSAKFVLAKFKSKRKTVYLTVQKNAFQFYRHMGFASSRDLFMVAIFRLHS